MLRRLCVFALCMALAAGQLSCRATPSGEPDTSAFDLGPWFLQHLSQFLVIGIGVTVVMGVIWTYHSARRRQRQRNETLLQRGDYDVTSVGSLLRMLYGPHLEHRGIAATALIPLLPRLQPMHAYLLDSEQRNCLHRALNHPDRYLVCAALEALQQIGDASAIPLVEHLVKDLPDGYVQNAARACLQALRARVEVENRAQILLRPASVPGDRKEVLLRPVESIPLTPTEQLLRPGGKSGE